MMNLDGHVSYSWQRNGNNLILVEDDNLSLSHTHTRTEVCPLALLCVWSPSSNLIQPQGAPLPTTITAHNLSLKYPHNTKKVKVGPTSRQLKQYGKIDYWSQQFRKGPIWSLQFKIILNNYNFIVSNKLQCCPSILKIC